ncbi:PREDICTED: Bardet-Biedl syndrome 12 protein [Poecilia mexicana]|uniref:Bardet-Biedl syndrome 12 n=1 Tax=Poecilia mexicana TaxID=48701 RepID=A0A3B3X9I9_9TELE|nr:PREDICTED: Bardet-Biedl syndrome 12 protein [Poecilia mexicana]XP_014854216.1 PREDICTED: Bardet-Biedl syndrome 12 protein [Poecilia mexicana]XP_014854217.1 PREDICTED: Bardet-Biedl syndrome 12 protein [Poecilia mexicana]XP_014854218.1 PREDICTED: Bardet-Biedl syndrome 12 protein [Poecilia mexicana]
MLEGVVINSRQHVGLQKLSALSGRIRSSVGPFKNYKFIQDESSGDSVLVCSCFRIIENLEPTCAVGQLVYETVRGHHKQYHTGSGCLLFLAGGWSRAALDSLRRGISVKHIITAMSEGIDICLDVCKKFSVSFKDLAVMEKCTAAPGGTKKASTDASIEMANFHDKCLSKSGQRKVKLSRHFCEAKSDMLSTVRHPDQPDMIVIAESLSHGCEKAMKLAVEAAQMLLKTNQQRIRDPLFDISKMLTCLVSGLPEDYACVVEGCILLLSDEQAAAAHVVKQQPLKVALITGDLSQTYRHLGFKSLPGEQCVCEDLDLSVSSKEDEWVDKVVKLLLNLEVKLILTAGLVSQKVIQHCCRHQILVVEKVNSSVLKTIGSSTGAIPVNYATQLTESCVGDGVNVEIWRDLSSYERKSLTAVNISTGRSSGLVTVVVTSCVHGKLQALEDQFWACAYRLYHALKDRALLPGAGGAELLCVHQLQKQAEHDRVKDSKTGSAANLYRGLVLQLMADGLIDYIAAVMVNTGRFTAANARTIVSKQLTEFHRDEISTEKFLQLVSQSKREDAGFSAVKPDEAPALNIYDNLSVKQEAWRKALDLVLLVLQTDAEIITGTGQKNEGNLMLL